ncbi:DUF1446 domain-containing protein [bacterium]|nr:DUF1446 domain-containing protein [bacterium]
MNRCVKIGNGQGFWGDSPDAPLRLVKAQPDLDYLTLDYLAEVSLSIMAVQREQDPRLGYARDFIGVTKALTSEWKNRRKLRVVTNAGGLNPRGCAEACVAALREAGCKGMKVGLVTGDDVLSFAKDPGPHAEHFRNWETGEPISTVADRLTTAHAYIGADSVAEALRAGADIVVTGRVADPSLTVAPCIVEFNWSLTDYHRLAQATIAGHLIECGTQVSGGILTDWLELDDPVDLGFPVVEVESSGSFIVTKPPSSGGKVSLLSVKEQFLYEMGSSDTYISPDCLVKLDDIEFIEEGPNRIRAQGARGESPTGFYKVSATYRDGFTASGMLTIVGRNAVEKARRAGEIVFERVRRAGFDLARTHIECLGYGDAVPGVLRRPDPEDVVEVVLRLSASDPRKEAVDRFAKEIAPMVTGGPPGTTGYATGRAKVRPVYGYWPCLVPRSLVSPVVEILEVT